jgi:hypothetical protein
MCALDKVVHLEDEDFGRKMSRESLRTSVFDGSAGKPVPSAHTLDTFTGQTPQGVQTSLLVIKQLAQGADLDVLWCGQLVDHGDVLEREGQIFLVLNSDTSSARAIRMSSLTIVENGVEQQYLRVVLNLEGFRS